MLCIGGQGMTGRF